MQLTNYPSPNGSNAPGRLIAANDFEPPAISVAHAKGVRTLPAHHSDPFDRILVSQAITEDLTLVIRDRVRRKYAISTIWM